MENRRKGMIIHSLWLTRDEMENIKKLDSNNDDIGIAKILYDAYERGDIEKR